MAMPKYEVIAAPAINTPDGTFCVWRVVFADTKILVSAFYGPSSLIAADKFCEFLNNSKDWN